MYTNNCRICLSDQCDIAAQLFTSDAEQNDFKSLSEVGEMYLNCLQLELTHNEDYPNHICHYCKLQLSVFHNFMVMAKRSYDKFTNGMEKGEVKSEKDDALFTDLEKLDESSEPDANAKNLVLDSSQNSEIEYLDWELEEAPSFEAVSSIGPNFNEYNDDQQEDSIMDDCVVEYLEDEDSDIVVQNIRNEFFEVKSQSDKDADSEKEDDTISYYSNDTDILEPLLKASNDIPDFYELEMLDGAMEDDQIITQNCKRKRGNEENGMPKDYECKQCNFIFTSADQLREHYTIHLECRLDCEVCGKKFKTQIMYQSHMNVHNGLPAFKCEICQKTFNFRSNYQIHMLLHTNQRPYQCDMCEKSYRSKSDLNIHMRVHNGIRKYECKVCGKRFRVSSHLTSHQYTHAEEKLFECDICHQKFNSPKTLKQHKNTVHSNKFRFYCSLCDRKFKQKHHVTTHLKTHLKRADAK